MLASGILGQTGQSLLRIIHEGGAGAVVTKSIGMEPREGHGNPSALELDGGLLNAMGLLKPIGLLNAMGLPNIEQLREDGVPTQAFATSAVSKPPLVQGLRLAFEQRIWKWIENEIATRELEAYTAKVTGNGNIKYSAPAGLHDDTVIARMLMFHQAMTGTFTLA